MDFWRLFEQPDYFLLAFDGTDALFVEMDREAYHRSIFCDRRISTATASPLRIPFAELDEFRQRNFSQPPNLFYIFHMAHCGSTLLSRALDLVTGNIIYREPFALRQLGVDAGSRFFGDDPPEDWRRRLLLVRTLLGRSYTEDGPVIVKGNVPVNFIIPELMTGGSDTRAVLLYLGLEDYLLAILRTQTHRNWVARVVAELNRGISTVTNVRQAMTLPKAAACLWLAQILLFDQTITAYPQVRSLNAEDLFDQPKSVVQRAFRLFGQNIEATTLDDIVSGELFSRYSKDPRQSFDNAARIARRDLLKKEIGGDIDEARLWIEEQASIRSIPSHLANSLTGESPQLMKFG